MKVAIYGAGAIGGWMGVRLAQAGCEVGVVARGATLEALQMHGLRLEGPPAVRPELGEGLARASTSSARTELMSVPVRSSADPAQLGVQDLVLVAVKAPAMADVAKAIGPLLGPDTIVLTAMNGVPWWFFEGFGDKYAGTRLKAVDPEGAIADAIPAHHIIGCVVHASCSLNGPGFVRQHFGNKLIVGEPSGEKTARVRQLVALLEQAGFETVLSDQIQKDAWYKLWGNMTVNPVSAMTGATTDLIMGDELVRGFISKVMLEAREIGFRIGIPIEQQPQDRHQVTRKLGAFKTSMLQDVEAGKPVELDALVTVVKELGELTGVPTPFTDALLGLARLHARVHGLY
ncbi:2-dehydropantoate 2-reductase [Caenimonas terrae]|uniref:2-dehydropantoate 2-reductase n=1 Tax=Caenimonas terrae TaxID=696074 RepID=A0ABW0NA98_9BURK